MVRLVSGFGMLEQGRFLCLPSSHLLLSGLFITNPNPPPDYGLGMFTD